MGILFVACVIVPSVGCATRVNFSLPPCPSPTEVVVDQVENLQQSGDYLDLIDWVSEIDRYCGAIDASM